jgi:hypothetical protein
MKADMLAFQRLVHLRSDFVFDNWRRMPDSVSNILLCLFLVRPYSEMLPLSGFLKQKTVESSWNVMAHGDALEGKWRETGEWSGWPVLYTLPRNMVYPTLLPLMRTPRLPVVDWTDAPGDLNGLVRFAERRTLVSARVCHHISSAVYLLYSTLCNFWVFTYRRRPKF